MYIVYRMYRIYSVQEHVLGSGIQQQLEKNSLSDGIHIKYIFCHKVESSVKKNKAWEKVGCIKD